MTRGDSGKAGVSAKTVVAGAAAAVAGVAAAGAAAAAAKGGQATERVPEEQPQDVTVVAQPPPDEVRQDVLLEASEPEGYTAPSSTEGVEKGRPASGDDPMIGGGNR